MKYFSPSLFEEDCIKYLPRVKSAFINRSPNRRRSQREGKLLLVFRVQTLFFPRQRRSTYGAKYSRRKREEEEDRLSDRAKNRGFETQRERERVRE